jgi:hypothetical protein
MTDGNRVTNVFRMESPCATRFRLNSENGGFVPALIEYREAGMKDAYPAIRAFKDPAHSSGLTDEIQAEYMAIRQRAAIAAEHQTRHMQHDKRAAFFQMWTQRLTVAKVLSLIRPTLH